MFQNIFVDREEDGLMVHLWDDQMGHSVFPYAKDFNYAYKLDPKGTITSLLGQRVKRVRRWAKEDPTILESDLPKETRVLTDLYLDSDEPATGHKIVIFDIEVDTSDGLPDRSTSDKTITSIALEDKVTGEEFVFILDEERTLDDYEVADGSTVTIFNAHTEEELLADFLDIWEQISPTIVTGWGIDFFDIPYLYRRLQYVLGADEALRLSPIRLVKYVEYRQAFQIAGVAALDYIELYKKFTYTEQPNYRLGTIGEIELGMGKYEYEGTLDELFKNDIEGFLEYNLRDIRIVSKLDNKMKLIQLVIGICTVGHVPYEEYEHSSRWLEGALVTDLHRKGIITPNKSPTAKQEMSSKDKSGDKGFEGAYVKEPTPGRHEWVFSLDLQSLYPAIIMSLNISPETKVGKVLNWNLAVFMRKEIDEYVIEDNEDNQTFLTRDELITTIQDGKFTLSSNGILYRTDKVGMIPETLGRWFAERLEYRAEMKKAIIAGDDEQRDYYDMRQHIQKIFLNSLYGVLGLPIFRFYDVDNALAVTATGQDVIKTSAKVVNAKYNKRLNTVDEDYCIYIDTDSVYYSSIPYYGENHFDGDDWVSPTVDLAREIESELNQFYNRMAKQMFFVPGKHRFVIKGEMVASAAFWVTKKRYALKKVYDLDADVPILDEMIVKGLDVVRSSFPAAFRKFMKEILTDILNDVPKEELDVKILEFHEHLSEMPIPDIARNTAVKNITKYSVTDQKLGAFITRTPAHVKAAITHNLLLREWNIHHMYSPIYNGDKIKWIYLKSNPYRVESIAFVGDNTDSPVLIKLLKEFIDYDKLFDKEFAKKLADFYEALRWGKIPTEINQKASEFFTF